MSVALAGMFGLITGVGLTSPIRERVLRYAGIWIMLGTAFLVLPARWYFASLPAESRIYLTDLLPGMQHVIRLGIFAAALSFVLAALFAVAKPVWLRAPVVALILLCGFTVMATGEYTREMARKPFVIGGYIYANDLRLASFPTLTAAGLANSAKWMDGQSSDQVAEGREMFAIQCGAYHSVNGYRAMAPRVHGWSPEFATDILQHLPLLRGTMPPFAGNERDRAAVGAFLASLSQGGEEQPPNAELGHEVFQQRCSMCHTVGGKFRPLTLAGTEIDAIDGLLQQLDSLNSDMPAFHGSERERNALAAFLQSGAPN
ncbi:MAG TPA: c-type cytochrome [Terriglobales bacterium]|nr:c-type cytochrome [Terriglobales bacterium]